MEGKYYGIEYIWEVWGDNPTKKVGHIFEFEKGKYLKFWVQNVSNNEDWRRREIITEKDIPKERGVPKFRSSEVQKFRSSGVPKFRSSEV